MLILALDDNHVAIVTSDNPRTEDPERILDCRDPSRVGRWIASIVDNLITPILGLFGDQDFSQYGITLKEGEVSEPIRTNFGWHVLKVEERRAPGLQATAHHRRRDDPHRAHRTCTHRGAQR